MTPRSLFRGRPTPKTPKFPREQLFRVFYDEGCLNVLQIFHGHTEDKFLNFEKMYLIKISITSHN